MKLTLEKGDDMPIKVPDNLPAREILNNENIFVMNESRAFHQDIRPLRIVILNLMPLMKETEVQLLRVLGNTPLQVEVKLLQMENYSSRFITKEYLKTFYHKLEDIYKEKFDGMIITGAPVEKLDFSEVRYWDELVRTMDWASTNVTSTMFVCWGAQAGLYHYYGVPKYHLERKISGIFSHYKCVEGVKLTQGFDDRFLVPQSRYTEVRREDILKVSDLEILSESEASGLYLVASKDGRRIFATGHLEYDYDTLKYEYNRDLEKGLDIHMPENYFPDNDPEKPPLNLWRSHGNLLYSNWLNYYVYQETPYEL